ncbi:MAG TPA: NAD(P)/FAD-dependent oxidoreductase [Solirubrobacteraceae bacterium]|nr:NAD(P)/FAD-dependent oxidoreductase [Solirubrobacteraceae bacterium]
MPEPRSFDVVIAGGGHNALVAATLLARAGRSVLVLERRDALGGAAASAAPFAGFDVRLSRYAYLVSLFPPALLRSLGVAIEIRPRRVASHPPLERHPAFQAMLTNVAERIFPTLTEPLRSRAEFRRLLGDDAAWSALFETPLSELIERSFNDDLARGTVLTDALIGTFAPADDPQLRQNRCFLYHVVGGPWNVPVGGMGALSRALAAAARGAGAELVTRAEVTAIETDERTAEVACADGRTYAARHVLANLAPTRLGALLGEPEMTDPPEGAQLKINMLLDRLPRAPGVSSEEAFTGTFHVNEGYEQLEDAYRQAAAGEIPAVPPCEVYCHSLTDPSILPGDLRAAGVQTLTLFGLHMPARLFGDRSRKEDAVAATLRSVDSVLAAPIESCLLRAPDGTPCLDALTPPELEAELGMPAGHIFHRDLAWPFAESDAEVGRWGVETEHANVWLCGAGARRGGGVSGIPGHNAARAVLDATGRAGI